LQELPVKKLGFLFLFFCAAMPLAAEDGPKTEPVDPARGMTRSLNIEEAWVENAAYVFSNLDNDLSAGHAWELMGEWDFAFNPMFGGELDFPEVTMQQPLGNAPSTLAPVALGFRFVPLQFGTPESDMAGVLGIEAEGAYWFSPQYDNFPGLGNSLTLEAMGGWRAGKVFLQGLGGYTSNLGQGAVSGGFVNVGLGWSMIPQWTPQFEVDFNDTTLLDDGSVGTQWTLLPQIGFQSGEWTLEVGEEFGFVQNAFQPDTATILMIERDL